MSLQDPFNASSEESEDSAEMVTDTLILMRDGDLYMVELGKPLAIKDVFAQINADEEAVYVMSLDGLEPRELSEIFLNGLHGRVLSPSVPRRAYQAPTSTPVRPATTTSSGPRTPSDREESQHIREWAQANSILHNGRPLADRGRIPESIRVQYYASQGE